ncbi:PP2C family protein-serine/threonine phosphatase [Nocardia grenadensis]|uniref:PP2C family protein-serine/threonine phosphatase n=1 Tax=Nocardia grenadensis TaxID=931537 RepID=UPI000B0163BA|nr:GAF domain-containing SpoIIE family protein phosphatase [Nocardia grenadensis]
MTREPLSRPRRRTTGVELAEERSRTEFLIEASEALSASLNIERCTESVARLAARLADGATVVAPVQDLRLPVITCSVDKVRHQLVDRDPAAVPGLAEALLGFPPVPSRWIDPHAVPSWILPEDFRGPLGSVMIIALPGHGLPAGALVLFRRVGRHPFGERDEILAHLFAIRAGAALSAARLYAEQTAITDLLMRELLPPRLPRVHGVELASGYRASENHQIVGGDFYDVHAAAGTRDESLVVLGDVCGKGLEAAVLTGKIRNTLHALVSMSDDHEKVLNLLNQALLTSHHDRFATLVMASVAHRDGRVRIRLTAAGHPPPLIVRSDGTVEKADTRGQLIGVLPRVTATTLRTTLEPGESCLLYTDGITEARGGPLGTSMFGEHRLLEALSRCAGMPAEAVVEHVQMLAAQWVGHRQHDDIALVVVTAPMWPQQREKTGP